MIEAIPGWLTLLLSGTGFASIIVGVLVFVATRKRDQPAAEGEKRRDTIADRDGLIDQLQEDMKDLRGRMTTLEAEYEIERQWNRALVDHIYRQLPPPPPSRPARTT